MNCQNKIDGLSDESKQNFKDAHENYRDIRSWDGVHFKADTHEVDKVDISNRAHGKLALEFLPESVT